LRASGNKFDAWLRCIAGTGARRQKLVDTEELALQKDLFGHLIRDPREWLSLSHPSYGVGYKGQAASHVTLVKISRTRFE
jgi:hypothetical protein